MWGIFFHGTTALEAAFQLRAVPNDCIKSNKKEDQAWVGGSFFVQDGEDPDQEGIEFLVTFYLPGSQQDEFTDDRGGGIAGKILTQANKSIEEFGLGNKREAVVYWRGVANA